jgi:DNA polymerase I
MSQQTVKSLVLVDGSSYLYRAYHALPPLTNSKGMPTGAVYGVINMLKKLVADYKPARFAVVFDAGGKTFRDDMFEEYKAQRAPMPDELREQVEPLKAVIKAMGFPLLEIVGVEADDVIGTLAHMSAAQGIPCVISTMDKDMAQLVNDHVTLTNTMHGTTLDRQGVIQKFGVPPERIVDYLALVGDSVDNIPGVPKVGPKTASKWLNDYGTLDELVAHAHEIRGVVGDNLRASLDQLALARGLATIRCTVDLPVAFDRLVPGQADTEQLRDWFKRLEFNTWLRQLDDLFAGSDVAVANTTPALVEREYDLIVDQTAFALLLQRLREADYFVIDTETTSLDYMQAELVGLAFGFVDGYACYVPVGHDYVGVPTQLDREAVLAELKPILEDPKRAKVGQHIKYDMHVLLNYGIQLAGVRYDTMLESYVLNSTATRHDMDSLSEKYLNRKTIHYEDVAGKGAKQICFSQVPLDKACRYSAEDANVTAELHATLWPRLRQQPKLRSVFEDLEVPLIHVLMRMERCGVMVDTAMLAEQSQFLLQRMQETEEEAFNEAGQRFNLASPKQIQEILFDKLKLPVIEKTPKGVPSTAESVLQQLAEDYRLPQLIMDYRGLAKLKSTYTDRLPEQVNPKTGRIHTSYHQAVAATGRLSSTDPNLQNIPVRTEEGRRIRRAFVAAPGYQLLSADYSQIELRIMAHLSGDHNLVNAFAAGLDIHTATAAEVFGVSLEAVSSEQRRAAKAINFGLIYGMSSFGLARQLGIDRGSAQEYIDLYFRRYPGVREFMDRIREQAHSQKYVETVFGRRLYLNDINSRNAQLRQYAERTAINAPMQGTAADIIKMAMLSLDEWIRECKLDVRMVMQVHDELVFEVPQDEVMGASAQIRWHMEQACELRVPLVVDVGCGTNWDEAH